MPPAVISALVNAICRFSWRAADIGEASLEVEVNPLIVLPQSRGVRVVNALTPRRQPEITLAANSQGANRRLG